MTLRRSGESPAYEGPSGDRGFRARATNGYGRTSAAEARTPRDSHSLHQCWGVVTLVDMVEIWFRLENAAQDAGSALAFTRARLEEVSAGDSSAWRWVVLGLHLALQDFVVAAFPNSLFAMDEKRAEKFITGMEKGVAASELPNLRIDWFPNLYDRMKEVTGYTPGEEVDRLLIGIPDEDVHSLHSLRNGLVHHFPGGWSIHGPLLLDCVGAGLRVIDHLGWHQRYTNHVYWHDDVARERAHEDVARCVELLEALRSTFDDGT